MKIKTELLAILTLLFLCNSGYCPAQCPPIPTDSNEWDHSLTFYLWLTAQNGDAVVRGTPVDVDISLSDAWDALSSLDGAATLHYEARKKRFSIIGDIFYIRLKDSVSTTEGDVQFEPSQTIAELATAYEVSRKDHNIHRLQTVEVLGGLRYNRLGLDLSGAVNVEGDQSWIDSFVGARFTKKLSDRWLFWTRGDIGGFSIGNASDFSWNLIIGGQYGLSDLWKLYFGWRWLNYDYDTGSGSSRFEYDVLMQGPFLGFQYNW